MDIGKLKLSLQADEAVLWERIQALRAVDLPELFKRVEVNSRDQAIRRGIEVVREVIGRSVSGGLDFNACEPGHGSGHVARDYVNALRLLSRIDADPRDLFVGFAGGVLHDLACGIVERYAESGRAVRHAEAGALLVLDVAKEGIGLNDAEANLIAYAVAAHTNYLKPSIVRCSDGVGREILPYRDTDEAGNPYLGIHFPRWIDRLECNGPTFVARHFLTLAAVHEDFDGETHFEVNFPDHMRCLLRTPEEVKAAGGEQTMLEHIHMFWGSQTNASPYGKYDYGTMVEFRDAERDMLRKIIEAVRYPQKGILAHREQILMDEWEIFLHQQIEPTHLGWRTARKLCHMFRSLDLQTQVGWLSGFREVMSQYRILAAQILKDLDELPQEYLLFPPIVDDLVSLIRPALS